MDQSKVLTNATIVKRERTVNSTFPLRIPYHRTPATATYQQSKLSRDEDSEYMWAQPRKMRLLGRIRRFKEQVGGD